MNVRDLEAHRESRWHLRAPDVRTEEEALRFIAEIGLCAEFSHKVLPTLYGAVHSDERPDEKGWNWDRIDRAWRLALGLARKRKIYYGKFFGGNTVVLSLGALPSFLRIYAPADYLEEYLSGRLPRLGKEILDVLTEFGVQSSEDLRSRLSLKGKEGNARFKSALTKLQAKGLLSAVGAVRRGRSGWDVLLWEPVDRWLPGELRETRDRMDREDALVEVVHVTLNAIVFGTLDGIRKTLKQRRNEVRDALAHLVDEGRAGTLARKGKDDLYHINLKGES
jgi:hypothetical protein